MQVRLVAFCSHYVSFDFSLSIGISGVPSGVLQTLSCLTPV